LIALALHQKRYFINKNFFDKNPHPPLTPENQKVFFKYSLLLLLLYFLFLYYYYTVLFFLMFRFITRFEVGAGPKRGGSNGPNEGQGREKPVLVNKFPF